MVVMATAPYDDIFMGMRQGFDFFLLGQKKKKKVQKCTNMYQKRTFITTFEKVTLLRTTIAHMKGL